MMMVEETGEAHMVQDNKEMAGNEAVEVRMLTLNVWAIPGCCKDRAARINAICQQIMSAESPYHYVMLQEVWSSRDYKIIADKLQPSLPHSHFFHSGVIGAGLCIFSCTPLTSTLFHAWSVNGLPHKVHHGDWWGGKGVALCRTRMQGHKIVLATTHLHAVYHHLHDEYLHHRVVQAYETSQVLDWGTGSDHTLLLGGDLNSEQHEVPYRLLRHNARLRDAFMEAPNKPVDGIGATNETPGNSYTSVASLRLDPTGRRIDHVLYRPAADVKVKVKLCDLPWPLRVPGANYSFSDHEAVRTVFSISPVKSDSSDGDDKQVSSNGPSPHRFMANRTSDSTLCNGAGNNSTTKGVGATPTTTYQLALHLQTDALHLLTDTLLDSAAVCAQGMTCIDSSRNFYGFVSVVLAVLNVILIVATCGGVGVMSGGFVFLLLILLLVAVLVMVYCVWLLFVWNRMERNALTATQLGLQCLLEDIRKKNAAQFQMCAPAQYSSKTCNSK